MASKFFKVGEPLEGDKLPLSHSPGPIPGGCSLTSDLYIDPNIDLTYSAYSTVIKFQDSDIGFSPSFQSYPVCDLVRISKKRRKLHTLVSLKLKVS